MAILNVPGDYPTIADAVAASTESDTIHVGAGYSGNESVTVTTDNLTFDIAATVPNIVLNAGDDVSNMFVNGYGPVRFVATGDAGDNNLEGIGNTSLLYGEDGNDTLTSRAYGCTLDGGNGNDVIRTASSNNLALGGAGDDILIASYPGGNTFDGGAGFDMIQYATQGDAVVNLLNGTAGVAFWMRQDTLRNIEGVSMGVNYATNDTVILGNTGGAAFGGAGDDTLTGGTGDDRLNGGEGNDTLKGGAGIDTLDYTPVGLAATGNGVTVDLSAGTATDDFSDTDTLTGIENVIGTDVADRISGNSVANALTGNDGDDTLSGRGGADILSAGAGNDMLVGGQGNDTLHGGLGIDTVDYSLDGGTLGVTVNLASGKATDSWSNTDTLTGIENVVGTESSDSITGDVNANALTGDAGMDMLSGGGGNDILSGGAGNDALNGGAGIDTANYLEATGVQGVTVDIAAGTAIDNWGDTDTLLGIENVIGSSLGDYIGGNGLSNVLTGNDGNDTLNGGRGADTLDGGANSDTVSYLEPTGVHGVTVNLATGTATDNWGATDSLISVENVVGSDRPDSLTGDGAANILTGGGGDDLLSGGANSDTLDGGAGIDTADYYDPAASHGVYVNLGENRAIDGYLNTDVLTGIENVIGSSLNDLLQGDALDNVLTGNAGDDQLFGGDGRDTASYLDGTGTQVHGVTVDLATLMATDNWGATDTLTGIENVIGSSLDDALTGDANANSLTGGAGNDILTGGGGNDLARYDDDPTTTSGVTVDLSAGTATDSWGDTDTLVGIEKVVGSRAADTLTGDANANTLNGAGGDDILFGGDGDDWLLGARGADRMEGGAGNDRYRVESTADRVIEAADGGKDTVFTSIDYTLGANVENLRADSSNGLVLTGNELDNVVTGGNGNDTLNGGAGRDTLTGGLGRDTFLFDSTLGPANVDLVADFSVAEDSIELSQTVFTQLANGPLAPDAFVIASAAQDVSDRIIYNSSTGVLSYDADGSGSGAAVNFAKLTPGLSLTSSDFTVL